MSARADLRLWAALALALAACGPSAELAGDPATAPAPAAPSARAAAGPATAACRTPASAEPAAARPPARAQAIDPAIATTVEGITRGMLERDLAVLAQPRHHGAAPKQLAAVAKHIETELGAVGFEVHRQRVTYKRNKADNVIAERAGSEPERVIIVCGHYDAVPRTPGADDNASGVAGTLAVARALGPLKTRATLRAIAFAFEEQGLIGSAAYAQALDESERTRIAAVVNLDMIAYRDRRPGSQRTPLDEARPPLARAREEGDYIAALGLADTPDIFEALSGARAYVPGLRVEMLEVPRRLLFAAADLMRSDHASFWGVDVPAITIEDTADARNPHYHRTTDTVATLDLDFATDVTRWVAAAVLLLDRSAPSR